MAQPANRRTASDIQQKSASKLKPNRRRRWNFQVSVRFRTYDEAHSRIGHVRPYALGRRAQAPGGWHRPRAGAHQAQTSACAAGRPSTSARRQRHQRQGQTAMSSAPDMVLIADADLQRMAEENGPASAEAQALAQLKSQRSQDLQVHCYRVGDTYVTGPRRDAIERASPDGELLEILQRAREN